MIILALLFLFDLPYYNRKRKSFREKEHAITIYGNCVFLVGVLKNKNDIVYKLYRLKLQSKKDHIWSFSPFIGLEFC